MPRLTSRLALLFLALAAALLGGGCLDKNPDDSKVPWNRPASWENQGPAGFGGLGSGGGF